MAESSEIRPELLDFLRAAKGRLTESFFNTVFSGELRLVPASGHKTGIGNSLFTYYKSLLGLGMISYGYFHEATETGICKIPLGDDKGDIVIKPIYTDVEASSRTARLRIEQYFEHDSRLDSNRLPVLEQIISGPHYFDVEGRRGAMLVKEFIPGQDYSKLLYGIMAVLGHRIPTLTASGQLESTEKDLTIAGEMLYLDNLQRVHDLQRVLPPILHTASSVVDDMQRKCYEVFHDLARCTDVDLSLDEETAYGLSIRNLDFGAIVREDTVRRNVAATFRNIIRPNGDPNRFSVDKIVRDMMQYRYTMKRGHVTVGRKSPVIVDVPFPYKNSHFLEDVAELEGSYEASFIPSERRRQLYERVFTRDATTPRVSEEESRLIHLYRDLRKSGIYIHYFGARNFALLARSAGRDVPEYEKRNELYILNIHYHLARIVENAATLIDVISRRLEERWRDTRNFSEQMSSLTELYTRAQTEELTPQLARNFCALFSSNGVSGKNDGSTTTEPFQPDLLRLASVMYLHSFARKADRLSVLDYRSSNLVY